MDGWNKKLAAEYRESAAKIKGRIDALSEEIRGHIYPNGSIDTVGAKLAYRRMRLSKLYCDTVEIAHILENYYVDK